MCSVCRVWCEVCVACVAGGDDQVRVAAGSCVENLVRVRPVLDSWILSLSHACHLLPTVRSH
mgnify:CR=1 FL=1